MHRKGLMRSGKTKAAAIASVAAAGLFVTASPAGAAGFNWDDQMGPDGQGCYAWTTWSQYMVQPHIWRQPGNFSTMCVMAVYHIGYDANWNATYWGNLPDYDLTAPSTGADGPNWYYGPWNGNGHMCVEIDVQLYGNHWDDVRYC